MTKTKLFYNGTRLKDIYVGATKWQVFKFRLFRFVRKASICAFVLGAIVGAYKVGNMTTVSRIVYADDTSTDMLNAKIDGLKDKIVAEVQSCESGGHAESEGIIIFDSNQKASIGTMQFQVKTVQHYYKTLYGKDLTPKEATLIALDDEKAVELAKRVMFETKNMAGKDWYNCAQKLNSDEKIIIIKGLES